MLTFSATRKTPIIWRVKPFCAILFFWWGCFIPVLTPIRQLTHRTEKDRPAKVVQNHTPELLFCIKMGKYYGDNGKENGNYYSILELYWDNGKENGNYHSILGLYWDNGKENGNYYGILCLVSLRGIQPTGLA